MAQIVVREIEDDVKEGLKRRAKRHGRSMEDEIRQILRAAAKAEPARVLKLGSRIARRFSPLGLRQELPEYRGHPVRPADLDR